MRKIIKKIIKESDEEFDWIRNVSDEIPEIDDSNKFLVLVNILGIDKVFGDVTGFEDPNTNFSENTYTHYGITTFTLDNGEEWAVGTQEEFDNALYEYWHSYIDDVGVDGLYNKEYYITMTQTDRRLFADDMARSYVEDLSDDDCLSESGLDSEYYDLESEIDELNDRITDIEDDEDMEDEVSELKDRVLNLESEKDSLIDRSRDIVYDNYYDDWYDCLEDPKDCLVRQHGLYSSVDDLINYNVVIFDNEKWVEDQVNNGSFGDLSSYDGDYWEDSGYVAIRIN